MPANHGFQLQESDVELLNYVFQLRLATMDHLATLSGRSMRALWNRLLKLKQRRYLVGVARFMQKQVYGIGPQGVMALVEQGYAPHEFTEKRLRHRELSEIGIRHSLFIADIHARLMTQTRTGPIVIAHWQESAALWDSVVVKHGEGVIPVRPDAYFILKQVARSEGKTRSIYSWKRISRPWRTLEWQRRSPGIFPTMSRGSTRGNTPACRRSQLPR